MHFSFEIFSCNSLVPTYSSSLKFEQNFRKLKLPTANFRFAFKKTRKLLPHFLPQRLYHQRKVSLKEFQQILGFFNELTRVPNEGCRQ